MAEPKKNINVLKVGYYGGGSSRYRIKYSKKRSKIRSTKRMSKQRKSTKRKSTKRSSTKKKTKRMKKKEMKRQIGRKKKTKKQSGGVKIKNRNLETSGRGEVQRMDYQAHLPPEGIPIEGDDHGVSIVKYEEYAMQDCGGQQCEPGTFMYLMQNGPILPYKYDTTRDGLIKGGFVILKRMNGKYIMRCLFVADSFNRGKPHKYITSECINMADYEDETSLPMHGDQYEFKPGTPEGPGEKLGHTSLLDKTEYDFYYNYIMDASIRPADHLSGTYRCYDTVTMAGEIYFKPKAGIVSWNNLSGHFLPNKKDVEYVKKLDSSMKGWSGGIFADKYDGSIRCEEEMDERKDEPTEAERAAADAADYDEPDF